MFLGLIFLIVLGANVWLGWVLGSWIGIGTVLVSLPIIILLMVGGGLALGLVGMIFGKHDDRTQGKRFLRSFLRGWAWLVLIVWSIPWVSFGALVFTNEKIPATLPRITISNGEKTVIFQSMMHIASPEFYDDIRNDMRDLSSEDYVFFYEGVKSGSEQSLEKLSQLMGTDISEDMYNTMADIAGLTYQGDKIYTDILPSTNVDLSTDEIVALAAEKSIPEPTSEQIDIVKIIQEKYPLLSSEQKYVARVIAQGGMNMLLRKYTDPRMVISLKKTVPVFSIILDKRDSVVVDAINTSPNQNIYMHYGALHFPGILAGLQEKDSRWKEVSRTELTVIR